MNNHELIEYLESTSEVILPVGKTTENRFQEFKKELSIDNNSSKGKLLKHIIAFANTSGRNLSCIYYGIEENKDKVFKICGIDINLLQDSDTIKDLITQYIYPLVKVDIIAVHNDKIFPNKDKVIQVLKIEGNSNRPYRFKQTISKKDGFIEGAKYYRDNHNSNPIPVVQEDEIIKNWVLEDAGLIKRIFKNLELLALIAVVFNFFSRIPGKISISYHIYPIKLIAIISLISIIFLSFIDRIFGKNINNFFRYNDTCLVHREETLFKCLQRSQSVIFGIFIYELFLHILFVSFIDAPIFMCFWEYYYYYSSCKEHFASSLLMVVFITSIFLAMIIPFAPLINMTFKKVSSFLNRGIQSVKKYL